MKIVRPSWSPQRTAPHTMPQQAMVDEEQTGKHQGWSESEGVTWEQQGRNVREVFIAVSVQRNGGGRIGKQVRIS